MRTFLAVILTLFAMAVAVAAVNAQPRISPKYTQVGADCYESKDGQTRIARDTVCTKMAGKWDKFTDWDKKPK